MGRRHKLNFWGDLKSFDGEVERDHWEGEARDRGITRGDFEGFWGGGEQRQGGFRGKTREPKRKKKKKQKET